MSEQTPSRQIVYQGRKIKLALETALTEDGTPYQRDIILHPGAVAILPLVDEEQICLVQNHRPNVGTTLLEIPAGTLEAGEPPDEAAARELAEETGYRAAHWQKLTEFYPSPGVLSEKTHLYVARQLTAGTMNLEIDEQLQPCLVAWNDAVRWVKDGTICDAKTIVAVLLWEALRQ